MQNLVVEGTVSGGSYAGGVAGYLEGASLIRCGSRAEVSGSQYVGGVAGAAKSSSVITECFSTGAVVSTTGYAGGVFGGPAANNAAILSYCYNTGTVSGPATVGGLAGGHKRYTSTYQNSYNAGNVTASMDVASNHGAVVGGKGGTFENLYYRTGCVTNVEEGGIAGEGHDAVTAKTEEEMKEAAFAASLNGDGSAFAADENGGYPVLAWQGQIDPSKAEEPGYHFQEETELSARLADMIKSAIDSTKETGGLAETDSLLGSADWMSGASSTGTDWMALVMGRFGYFDPEGAYHFLYDDGDGYALYNAAMKQYIEATYEDNGGILHSTKATEWHRATVAIAALGGDPRHFGVYEGKDIDLIADGTYDNQSGPGRQGINGWIWGLIALDSGAYEVPDGAKYTRDDFITEILKLQLADGVDGNVYGGWDLFAGSSDPDITAMAVQALAPYYFSNKSYTYVNAKTGETLTKTVRQVVEEALDRLGSLQREAGDFASWGTVNSESTAQVLVALTALGIDPAEDDRFITGTGKTLLDGLLQYRTANGGFSHTIGGGWNSMANDQAAYALVAYWRLRTVCALCMISGTTGLWKNAALFRRPGRRSLRFPLRKTPATRRL